MKTVLHLLKKTADILLWILIICLVLVTLLVTCSRIGGDGRMLIGGYGFGRVVTGSMEPSVPTGSFVVVRETDPSSLEVHDTIMFYSDDPSVPAGVPVTHRIERIERDEAGNTVFITKGTANEIEDPYPVAAEDVIGTVVFVSPLVGNIIGFAQKPWIYPLLIVMLAIDLIVNGVVVFRQAKDLHDEQQNNTTV